MGLDLVELVIATGKHFGIEIDDVDAPNIRTPAQLAAYVNARLALKGALAPGPCLTQRTFYRLRRTLETEWGIPKHSLCPNVPLETILPSEMRARRWAELHDALGARAGWWPELARPVWLQLLVATLSVLSFVALVARAPAGNKALATAVAGALMVYALGIVLTRSRMVRVVPAGYTVGHLAEYLSAYLPPPLATGPVWTHEEVRAQVRAIVSEQLGVSNFTDNSDFVRDLHAD